MAHPLFIRDQSKLTSAEQEELTHTRNASATAEVAYGLVEEFLTMVHECQGERLDAWIEAIRVSQIPELHHFVNSILKDKDAGVAGLTLAYRNGPVEAQGQQAQSSQVFDVWPRQAPSVTATLAQCSLIGTDPFVRSLSQI